MKGLTGILQAETNWRTEKEEKSATRSELLLSVAAWWRLTDAGRHHPLVVVRVDAHAVILQVEGVLAELDVLQLVLVEVRPAPQPRVDDVRETLPARHLRGAAESQLASSGKTCDPASRCQTLQFV